MQFVCVGTDLRELQHVEISITVVAPEGEVTKARGHGMASRLVVLHHVAIESTPTEYLSQTGRGKQSKAR